MTKSLLINITTKSYNDQKPNPGIVWCRHQRNYNLKARSPRTDPNCLDLDWARLGLNVMINKFIAATHYSLIQIELSCLIAIKYDDQQVYRCITASHTTASSREFGADISENTITNPDLEA